MIIRASGRSRKEPPETVTSVSADYTMHFGTQASVDFFFEFACIVPTSQINLHPWISRLSIKQLDTPQLNNGNHLVVLMWRVREPNRHGAHYTESDQKSDRLEHEVMRPAESSGQELHSGDLNEGANCESS